MKKIFIFFQTYSFVIILSALFLLIFKPLILHQEIPFSSNLLVSFFNPWTQEKFPGWEQGIPNKPIGIDDIRIFYPQRHLTIEEYLHGILPLWNPYSFSGNYQAGLSETAVFYPLSFLFLLLPQLPTWILLLVLEPVVISIGTLLFLRLLQLSKPAAIFGAIVFGFSGLVMVRMVEGFSVGHTLMWTPFALYGIEGFLQKRKGRYLLISLAAMACSLLAGWFQFAFYTVVLGFIYAFYRWWREKNKIQNLFVFLPFIFLPLTTLFQIIPALEALSVSSRGATSTQQLLNLHLMPWNHLLTYIFPDFFGNPGSYNFFGKSEYKESILYIGVIPFVLSLFALSFWRKHTYILFFSLISIFGVILGIDNPLTRNVLSFPLPIISSFLPNRVFYFATIGLSILSAYGFEAVLAKKIHIARIIFVSVFIGALGIIANGFIFYSTIKKLSEIPVAKWFVFLKDLHIIGQAYQIDIAKHNLYLSDAILLGFVFFFIIGRLYSKKVLITGIFALTMLGQVYFAQKYIPFSQTKFVFPQHPIFSYLKNMGGINRYVSTGNGYITTNSPLFYDVYSPDGVGSMYIERYGQLVTYMQTHGKDYTHIPRIEIRINPSAQELMSGENTYLLRFMQIDGIHYSIRLKSDPATVNLQLFTKVWENKTWEIYTFTQSLPRVFWTNAFLVEKTNQAILEKTFASKNKEVVLEKNPSFAPNEGKGNSTLMQYSPNKIVIRSVASNNGLIYISDNFVPQWKAYIDGKEVPVLRANYSFMAIPVTTGMHTIVLQYIDMKETIGLLVGGVSIIGICIGVIFAKKKKYL